MRSGVEVCSHCKVDYKLKAGCNDSLRLALSVADYKCWVDYTAMSQCLLKRTTLTGTAGATFQEEWFHACRGFCT